MAHSLLSPSKAHRWIACPPSALFETKFPDKVSKFADEGTLAHSFGELMLANRDYLLLPDSDELKQKYLLAVSKLRTHELYSPDMPGHVDNYVQDVLRRLTPDSFFLPEMKVHLPFLGLKEYGTADTVIVTNDTLIIEDLKYGKGVKVDAKENDQLKLYACGVLASLGSLYSLNRVVLVINQPRLHSISEWETTVDDLRSWLKDIVLPAAKLAVKGEGEYSAGDHCKFCKAKAKCRAIADKAMTVAESDFAPANGLTIEEILQYKEIFPVILDWVKAVEDYIFDEACKGTEIPGFKLVEARSNRKIAQPEALALKLECLGISEELYMKKELKTITALERTLGKKYFSEIAGSYITKPRGSRTLVPESDPRPVYTENLFTDTTK